MKVQRLMFVDNASSGECLVKINDEVQLRRDRELDTDAMDDLAAGKDVKVSFTIAGLRIYGRLVPAHSRHREALQSQLETRNPKPTSEFCR